MAGTPGESERSRAAAGLSVAGVWRLEGDVWIVGLNGRRIPVRDTKGARHLHELLRRPRAEIGALELAAARLGPGASGDDGEALPAAAGGDLGAALDPEAKAAYRARLRDLEQEAEEADRFHDPERAERARSEADFLMRELAAAVGLRGRDRPQGSTSEKARLNVTRSIRAAIDRAARHDPELGAHLRASVRTGAFCSYEPVEEVEWELEAPAGEPAPGAAAPAAVQSVLFVDVVGSTQTAAAMGDRRWSKLLERHGDLLRARATAHGVRLGKLMGDGALLLSDAPSSAVACALDLVAGSRELGLELRAGIHAGEIGQTGEEVTGLAVHIGARVGALAGPGEVLVSATVRDLLAGAELSFEDRGVQSLRGVPGQWRVYAAAPPGTAVSGAPAEAAQAIPLPPRLAMEAPTAYVGRAALRERLAGAWRHVRDGRRRVVLLGGEPGIGKTRLATEVARACHADGGVALYGGCEPDTGLAYAPWAAVLDHLVTHAPDGLLRAHADRHGGHLARLVPALRARIPDLRDPPPGDPEADRLMLFAAISGLICDAAARRPLVLVLDDLHWADAPSLAALRHLVIAGRPAPLLLILTHRDTELDGHSALEELLAVVQREPDFEAITMSGLAPPEVVELMASAAGHDLDADGLDLAARLHAGTEGNPFFLVEMLRDLAESGAVRRGEDGRWRVEGADELHAPAGVRDVIARRLDQLGESAVDTLTTAAAVGRSFELDVLLRASGDDEDDLVELLDRAVTASVLAEIPGAAERFMFTHALTVHTLYDRISRARRTRLHRAIAHALEELCGDDPGERIAELAHHWTSAVPAVDARTAIGYARRAAERALEDFAPAEALRWYRRALELHRGLDAPDPLEEVDLLTGLGEAQRRFGDAEFRTTLLAAAGRALELGDTDRLVAAALANTRGYHSSMGVVDGERIAMLEAALERVGGEDPRRARLLALLAAELLWDGDAERRMAHSDEALSIARAAGDPAVLAQVLSLRIFAIWAPETLAERIANVDELTALAATLDDPLLGFWAHVWRYMGYVQACDREQVELSLERQREFAAVLRQPGIDMVRLIQEGSWAIALGDYGRTERLVGEALEAGRAAGEPDVDGFCAGMITAVRIEQRSAGEMVEILAGAAAAMPVVAQFRALHAQARLDAGDEAGARAMLDEESPGRFASVPVDPTVTATLAGWADVCARAHAAEHAPALLDLLATARGQYILQATMVLGPVTRYTACLLALLGRLDEAAADFADALASAERMGGAAFAARTRAEYAALLVRRGAPGDHALAAELAADAARAAAERGYGPVGRLADQVLGDLRAAGVAVN